MNGLIHRNSTSDNKSSDPVENVDVIQPKDEVDDHVLHELIFQNDVRRLIHEIKSASHDINQKDKHG